MKYNTLLFIIVLFNSIFINGQSWTIINSPTNASIQSCSFINENLGWIVTSTSIHKTTDGGANWTTQSFPVVPSRFLNSIHFINQNVGIIACGNYYSAGSDPNLLSTILWTNDGGTTWVYKDLGSYNDWDTSAILVSPLIAYSIGQYGQSKKTIDGGVTWTPCTFSSNTGYSGSSLFALNQNTIYFAGLQNIYLTAAIGKMYSSTWMITNLPGNTTMTRIFFSDVNNGWVVGSAGTIKSTNNGGTSWVNRNSNVTSTITGVSFKNAQQGWAVTDGKIIKSVDGGINWAVDYSDSVPLSDITFNNLNGYGYAVGDTGRILKYNPNLINENFDIDKFIIYPNPISSTVYINNNDLKSKKLTVEIANPDGKIVKRIERNNSYNISVNMEDFASGLYFLRIINEDNKIYVKKIIKI